MNLLKSMLVKISDVLIYEIEYLFCHIFLVDGFISEKLIFLSGNSYTSKIA